MDTQKEYLNEEKYQKTKKMINSIAIVTLLVGIFIGCGLIGLGFLNRNSIDINSVRAQQHTEFFKNGLSEKYYDLEDQLNKAESSTPLFIIGGFVIVASCLISGSIFMSTKRREFFAYHVQQIRPVAQEGIEKVAPSIGVGIEKVAPSIGVATKEMAKGIKKGLKEE